jgi:predicted O-linked N-acetylglucosamine transferase (SPINDLY family)
MVTLEEALQTATGHFQAGRLAEAEAAYRQVLELDPANAVALRQLAALAAGARRFDEAAAYLERVVRGDSSQPLDHANLGACYRQLGKPADAEAAFRAAVRLAPGFSQVHTMLGALLHSQGRLAEAADSYRRVVEAEPNSADAHFDLASVLQPQGDLAGAAECYEQALKLAPNHVISHINLGTLRKQQGLVDEAIAHFQAALAGDPTSVTAKNNLAGLLLKLGRLDEAQAAFEEVAQANPRFQPAQFGLAGVHYRRGNLEQALSVCRSVLQTDPASALAHLSMGIMLNEQGRRDEAIDHLRRAIERDPRLRSAHGNLAIALHLTGRAAEALDYHRREIEINPTSSLHHSNLLYCLNFLSGVSAQTIFDEHRAWARKHADPLTAAAAPHANDRSPERRLRVGYVSPHFFAHAVNYFVEPILAAHDHREFEIFCYSDAPREDEATFRLRGYADCWRSILGQGHEQVARQIRNDQIDILIDLTGHIGENRMPVFARKPAPVQITYIGYQNTTGMQAMDYRLTDAYADPPGLTERYHTEQLVRLPRTFFCYRPPEDAPDVGPLPALANGFVTFASLNNFAKVTPEVLKTWAEILHAAPRSRLVVLAAMTPSLARYVEETFSGHGIAAERLRLVGHLPHARYMKLISEVDLALDPFPFNGHTTTCDCLWQGVPVVSLSGQTYVSRFGASALATLGLDELIAASREQYRQIAVGLAGDLERLARLRATLRPRMAASPLLDFATFTRNLEVEYRRMWRRWCQGVTERR